MNAAGRAPDEGLTTGQVAADGRDGNKPGPAEAAPAGAGQGSGLAAGAGRESGPAAGAGRESGPAAGAGQGSGPAAGDEPRGGLLEGEDLRRIVIRWKEIQAHFVDEPRTAVEQADALVAGLMQQLTAMFARERAELEQRWGGGGEVSTEELRQTLRRYRSVFERLLAV